MADERNRELERAAAAGDPAARAALSQARGREGEAAAFTPWRRLRDAGADLFAPVELNTGLDGLLHADLAPLGTERAARAYRFVLDGQGPALLDELAADPGAGAGMDFARQRAGALGEFRPRDVVCALRAPAALVRLGLLYDALGAASLSRVGESELAEAGFPRWLVGLVLEAERRARHALRWGPATCAISWPTLEAVTESAGIGNEGLLAVLLDHGDTRSRLGLRPCANVLQGAPGLDGALVDRHVKRVRAALQQEGVRLGAVCGLLLRHAKGAQPFAEALARAATRSNTSYSQASPVLQIALDRRQHDVLRPHFEALLGHSQAPVRLLALRCLARFGQPNLAHVFDRVASTDRSRRVRQAAQAALSGMRLIGAHPQSTELSRGSTLEPMPASQAEQLDQALRERGVTEVTRAHVLDWLNREHAWRKDDETVLDGILGALVADAPDDPEAHVQRLAGVMTLLDLRRRVRMLRLTGHLTYELRFSGLAVLDRVARAPCRTEDGRHDLAQLASALPSAGLDPAILGHAALEPRTVERCFSCLNDWDGRAYYAARPELIDEALRGGLTAAGAMQVWAQRLLAELEGVLSEQGELQPSWLEALVDLGTDTPKAKREFAQRVVDDHAVALWPLLEPQLRAKKGDRRANAARWLARRGERAAVSALREAVARERSAKVELALEEALAALA